MNEQKVELKVMITALNAQYKCQQVPIRPDGSLIEEQRTVIDTTRTIVAFTLSEYTKLGDEGGSLTLSTEDVRKLGIMIGDVLTLTLVKDGQN